MRQNKRSLINQLLILESEPVKIYISGIAKDYCNQGHLVLLLTFPTLLKKTFGQIDIMIAIGNSIQINNHNKIIEKKNFRRLKNSILYLCKKELSFP